MTWNLTWKSLGLHSKDEKFPVAPAFTVTANKAQGQTLPGKVAIYLWDDCFSHGELHVANSRATHPDHLWHYTKYQHHWDPKCCSKTSCLMNEAIKNKALPNNIILY